MLLQAEAARVPVDDPLTHLELTMVHEVMVLDHSGPELAAMQYAAAIKMTVYAGLIAALLNPFDLATQPAPAVLAALAIMAAVAVAVGCVESLMARLRMRLVPVYLMLASALAARLAAWRAGWRGARMRRLSDAPLIAVPGGRGHPDLLRQDPLGAVLADGAGRGAGLGGVAQHGERSLHTAGRAGRGAGGARALDRAAAAAPRDPRSAPSPTST